MTPIVECPHWKAGKCRLNRFGGRPSPGVCANVCEVRAVVRWGEAVARKPFDGSALWGELHTFCRDFIGTPDEFATWLAGYLKRLPCGDCRKHSREWVKANPPTSDLFAWSVDWHNAVNTRLGKATMTVEAARPRWS